MDSLRTNQDATTEPSSDDVETDNREAIGGWSADEARGYYDHTLVTEIENYITLYGVPSFLEQVTPLAAQHGIRVEVVL